MSSAKIVPTAASPLAAASAPEPESSFDSATATATSSGSGNRLSLPLPPIRVIKFEDFKQRSSFPRYPQDRYVNVDAATIDRKNAFFVYVSHNWLRGYDKALGWDGRPHPDNAAHDKFKLCVEGIEKIMKSMAPGAKQCFIWLDFGCINQDDNPLREMTQLDEIMRLCDCIFTPIHGENKNVGKAVANIYEGYHASTWNEGPYSYTQRGWCRLEMLYAANIPLIEDKARAKRCFQAGLKLHMLNGVRPHIIYGTTESKGNFPPKILPPLNFSYFEKLNPQKGKWTIESDRFKIKELEQMLRPWIKYPKLGYDGPRDAKGKMSGRGIFRYAGGDVYEGDFLDDKQSGKGLYRYASGSFYEGDFLDDKKSGKGVFRFINGAVYDGDFLDDKPAGKGVHNLADGDVYEGSFLEGKYSGKGVYRYASGSVYEGEFVDGKKHGKGIFRYASGNVYEGEFKEDKQFGKATFRFANGGGVYQGDVLDDKPSGSGILKDENGSVIAEGKWKEGKYKKSRRPICVIS